MQKTYLGNKPFKRLTPKCSDLKRSVAKSGCFQNDPATVTTPRANITVIYLKSANIRHSKKSNIFKTLCQ